MNKSKSKNQKQGASVLGISDFKEEASNTVVNLNDSYKDYSGIFESFVASADIPFLSYKTHEGDIYYKVYNGIETILPHWIDESQKFHTVPGDNIVILVNIVKTRNKNPKDILKKYKFSIINTQKNILMFDYSNEYHSNRKDIYNIIYNSFSNIMNNYDIASKNFKEGKIEGTIIIENSGFTKTAFSHFIALKKYRNDLGFKPFLDERNISAVSNIRFNFKMLKKETGKEEVTTTDSGYKVYKASISKKNSNEIILGMGASNYEDMKDLIFNIKNLFEDFKLKSKEIELFYRTELNLDPNLDIDSFINQSGKAYAEESYKNIKMLKDSLERNGKDMGIFEKDYTRKCQNKYQPYVLDEKTKDYFEEAKEEYLNREETPADIENKLVVNYEDLEFACIRPGSNFEFPIPGFLQNGNPCCYTETSAKENHKTKNIKHRAHITTINKKLNYNTAGPTPFIWNRMLKFLDKDKTKYIDNKYMMLGMGGTGDSFLRCFLYATNPEFNEIFNIGNEENTTEYIEKYKQDFEYDNDIYINDYINRFSSDINICFFSIEKKLEDTQFIMFDNSPSFDINLDSMIIFLRHNEKKDNKDYLFTCELFIDCRNENETILIGKDTEMNNLLGNIVMKGYNKYFISNNTFQ